MSVLLIAALAASVISAFGIVRCVATFSYSSYVVMLCAITTALFFALILLEGDLIFLIPAAIWLLITAIATAVGNH